MQASVDLVVCVHAFHMHLSFEHMARSALIARVVCTMGAPAML